MKVKMNFAKAYKEKEVEKYMEKSILEKVFCSLFKNKGMDVEVES